MSLALSLVLVLACKPVKPDGDGGGDGGATGDGGAAVDLDGDGYSISEGDCDDGDPQIHPGAADAAYDGVDSDCAGDSDFDADGDGHDSAEYGGEDCDDTDDDIHPGATDAPYDEVDADCAGDSDFDADGDGYDSAWHGGDDCNDNDPASWPGAYDRPDDGIDQDCDGTDRHFDGVALGYGETLSVDVEVDLGAAGVLDVAVLLDTTCSMSNAINSLSFRNMSSEVASIESDLAVGYATYDDYYYGSYGTSVDQPFQLRQQLTQDWTDLSDAHRLVSLHSGSDGPESTFEALYQAITGAGYDQDCDASFDSSTDVKPFLASSSDPFGGLGGSAGDSSTALGTEGGFGFRSRANRLIVYITDNYLRDPDSGYGSPGGCPLDAGSGEVHAYTSADGWWFYGISTGGSIPITQMNALADATGSHADLDGDGDTERMVETWDGRTNLGTRIGQLIAALAPQLAGDGFIDELRLEVVSDYYGLIRDISPDPARELDLSMSETATFTITLQGTIPGTTTAEVVELDLRVVADGEEIGTVHLSIEIPPA